MKFLKIGFLFGVMLILLSTQCFSMESPGFTPRIFANPNPLVTTILDQLKTKSAAQTLQPEEFWAMMAGYTGMGSYFLGEFIGNALECDVCMVIKNLIRFGKEDKNKFCKSMLEYTGIDGITPLNELIRYMPEASSESSEICCLFTELLDLIKTLDAKQVFAVLNQSDWDGTEPIVTAKCINKNYIVHQIATIIFTVNTSTSPSNQ